MTAWHAGWLLGPRAVRPGHACEATSASRPARPGGRAGPAVGSARGLGASWADSVAWAGMAVGELGQGDGQATSWARWPFYFPLPFPFFLFVANWLGFDLFSYFV